MLKIGQVVSSAVLGAAVPLAAGDTYTVSPQWPETIQALIDFVLVDGDVVQLEAGDYLIPEPIQVNGVSITIRGVRDAKSGDCLATLNGQGEHRILYVNHPNCTIADLRLADGNSTGNGTGMFDDVGGAIFADSDGDNIQIISCCFVDNAASYGGAVYVRGNNAVVQSCGFFRNTSSLNGAALALFDSDHSQILESIFEENTAGNDGGAMYLVGRETLITDCIVKTNTAASVGGILVPSGTSTMQMSGSQVCGNTPVQVFGNWMDLGGNSVGVQCDCVGDIDGDGQIGGTELGLLFALWGTSSSLLDLNTDQIIDAADLGVLLGLWGACP